SRLRSGRTTSQVRDERSLALRSRAHRGGPKKPPLAVEWRRREQELRGKGSRPLEPAPQRQRSARAPERNSRATRPLTVGSSSVAPLPAVPRRSATASSAAAQPKGIETRATPTRAGTV